MAYPYGGYQAPYNSYTPASPFIQQQQALCGMSCRPVSSADEARGIQVQFDGNPNVFINEAAGEIYVKRFNFGTGSMDFDTFVKALPAPPVTYATAAEFEMLKRELAELKEARAHE